LPEDVARSAGLDPSQTKEGQLFEAASLTCSHCKVAVVKNPLRTRERATCPKCGHHYICDFCAMKMKEPDYTHTPFDKVVDDTLNLAAKGYSFSSPQKLILP
jgi:hypothetical protein